MRDLKKKMLVVKIVFGIFAATLAIILLNFGIHVHRVNAYNATERTIDYNSSATDVTVDVHPRGLATDTWEKNDAFEGEILQAKIYEATISNSTSYTLKDWNLRIDIQDACYLNNAWNGTVEVHQFNGDTENVQTLDLRDYSEDDITLDYYVFGQDLLIPLDRGDYIIYYPSKEGSSVEDPINSSEGMTGETNIGLIVYSLYGDDDLTHFTLNYYIEKGLWNGGEATIFMIVFPTWLILFLVFVTVLTVMSRYERRVSLQGDIITESLGIFAEFVDSKDSYSNGHSTRVAKYARAIAKKLGMKDSDADNVYYTALAHDIGKCYIPDYVISKSGKLSPEEFETMKSHTTKGAKMLEGMQSIPGIVDGALYHHERYDGTGYPTGKAGENIPLIGRIICIADAYVAMDSDRSYRKRLRPEEILKELEDNKGKQFDPVLVDVMLDVIRENDK